SSQALRAIAPRFADQEVSIRAGNSERTATGDPRLAIVPWHGRRYDTATQLIPVDVRVRHRAIEARRNGALVHGKDCLDQACDTGRTFSVADVGLRGADQ